MNIVSYLSYHYTAGRPYGIMNIIIHHMAGSLTAQACANVLNNRGASAHWCIGSDGVVGQLIDETDRAWHAGDGVGVGSKGNDMGIGIEVANDAIGGNWHVSDRSFELLIELCFDIAHRHNLLPLKHGVNLFGHRECSSTVCPGDYLQSKLDELCDRVNALANPAPTPVASGITYQDIGLKKLVLNKNTNLWNFDATRWADIKAVNSYPKGHEVEAVAIATNSLGGRYYMTSYSYNAGAIRATNGFNVVDCDEVSSVAENVDVNKNEEAKMDEANKGVSGVENVEDGKTTIVEATPVSEGELGGNAGKSVVMSKADYNEYIGKIGKSVDLGVEVVKKSGLSLNLSNRAYDVLKTLAVVVLPAISMLYLGLANIWGFGLGAEIDATISLLISTINALLGLAVVKASADYYKKEG